MVRITVPHPFLTVLSPFLILFFASTLPSRS